MNFELNVVDFVHFVASYVGCDRVWVVISFTVAMGLMGTYYPGVKVNPLDLSPNYAGMRTINV